jgi:glucokinase
MAHVALAGDIGGTKTNLALFDVAGRTLAPRRETSFPSRAYGSLEAVVAEFLREDHPPIGAAAFGIAGPVIGESVNTTNLPWRVEAEGLRRALSTPRVRLMNDLEATAYGALFLPPEQLETLNAGVPRPGHRGVIAAGTGLGQAFLLWDGKRHVPVATEGGHVDFAPRNAIETELLAFLRRDHERVSYERILSGPGLYNIFRFLAEGQGRPVDPTVARRLEHEDPGAVVGEAGTGGACATCAAAVDLFVDLYGAQAGNLALTVMAVGGVYVGGGIVTKMLPKMRHGMFLRSFVAKGRYRGFVSEIPVWIILEPKTALIGAAEAARALLDA